MVTAALLCHLLDDGGHVVQFLVVFGLGPLVAPVGEELVVVLGRVVVYVEEVLQVVETYYMVAHRIRRSGQRSGNDERNQEDVA